MISRLDVKEENLGTFLCTYWNQIREQTVPTPNSGILPQVQKPALSLTSLPVHSDLARQEATFCSSALGAEECIFKC